MERDSEIDQKESEKVLIERDGKFELVSASDMKAVETSSLQVQVQVQGVGEGEGREEGRQEPRLTEAAPSSAYVSNELKTEESKQVSPKAGDLPSGSEDARRTEQQSVFTLSQHASSNGNTSTANSSECQSSSLEAVVKSHENDRSGSQPQTEQAPSAPRELKAISQVRIMEAQKISATASPKQARPRKDLASGSAIVLRQMGHPQKRLLISRTKSAPGLRATIESDEENERKKRSDAAFKAWLARKNEEVEERRKIERVRHKLTEEELRQKRQQNEVAFQAWLASKNRELQEQRLREKESRPATSISKSDEAASSAAFSHWLNRKKIQHQRIVELEQKRHREEADAARKVDTTIVGQAYKR